jgi:hypothetical protein
MKRAFAISAVSTLAFVAILLHSVIKDFLWTHPWWHSFLVALPTIGLPILGMFLEERRSREAGTLQAKADDLQAQLDAERNKHLQQIARNTEKPVTQAERNADILRKHLRAKVSVTEGQGYWPSPPEIVEVEDNIVALFSPSSYFSSSAGCVRVHCDELEITDIPDGSCPLRLKVLNHKMGGPFSTGRYSGVCQGRHGLPRCVWQTRFARNAGPSCVCLQRRHQFVLTTGDHRGDDHGEQRRDFQTIHGIAH